VLLFVVAANAEATDWHSTADITAARVDWTKRAGRYHLEIYMYCMKSSLQFHVSRAFFLHADIVDYSCDNLLVVTDDCSISAGDFYCLKASWQLNSTVVVHGIW